MLETKAMSYVEKTVRFQSQDRTFEIHLQSSAAGYSVHSEEVLHGGEKVLVYLHAPIRYSVLPADFYASRTRYRGILLSEVCEELRNGSVTRIRDDRNAVNDLRTIMSWYEANLDGYPDGYAGAVLDHLHELPDAN
jgi:hypothetical protein